MKTESKYKKGFTLIELLVVVAIIALLLSIVVPSLRMAQEHARKVICRSNNRQIGVAIGAYESQTGFNFRQNEDWYYVDGTGDMPYESQEPTFARDMLRLDMLPNRQVFFCAGIRQVSYEKNFIRHLAISGDLTNYSLSDIESRMATDPTFTGQPAFWSTYAWLWKKRVTSRTPSVNNMSSGVLYIDPPMSIWYRARFEHTNDDSRMLRNIFGDDPKDPIQTVEHANALMQDLSVVNTYNKDEEVTTWLWNTTTWP